MPHQELVLVTGASGYLGSAVAIAFLEAGYSVRGTARTERQAQEWSEKYSEFLSRPGMPTMDWAIVPNMVSNGAYEKAVDEVTIFVHTASPVMFTFDNAEDDVLKPAIEGTRGALEAAHKVGSVHRFIYTSSFSAVYDTAIFGKDQDKTYSEDDWNTLTYEEAAKSTNGVLVYEASKTLAERVAWDFVDKVKPAFSLTSICPVMIYGPPSQVVKDVTGLNGSVKNISQIFDAETTIPTPIPVYVDVRDCAKMHVSSATQDIAKGKRYLALASHFDFSQIAAILREKFPSEAHRFPAGKPHPAAPHFGTNNEKTVKELGITWIPFEQTIEDTGRVILDLEKSAVAL